MTNLVVQVIQLVLVLVPILPPHYYRIGKDFVQKGGENWLIYFFARIKLQIQPSLYNFHPILPPHYLQCPLFRTHFLHNTDLVWSVVFEGFSRVMNCIANQTFKCLIIMLSGEEKFYVCTFNLLLLNHRLHFLQRRDCSTTVRDWSWSWKLFCGLLFRTAAFKKFVFVTFHNNE